MRWSTKTSSGSIPRFRHVSPTKPVLQRKKVGVDKYWEKKIVVVHVVYVVHVDVQGWRSAWKSRTLTTILWTMMNILTPSKTDLSISKRSLYHDVWKGKNNYHGFPIRGPITDSSPSVCLRVIYSVQSVVYVPKELLIQEKESHKKFEVCMSIFVRIYKYCTI